MIDPLARPETVPLRSLLREDFARYDRRPTIPGFHAIVVHRIGRRTMGSRRSSDRVVHALAKLGALVVRNVYGIELGFRVDVGRRVLFSHQGMIVVNNASRIGNDCVIRHGVTLGARNDRSVEEAPELRDGVEVGVNAVILGKVVIGERAKVGPLAVVLEDVPPGARVLAASAIVLNKEPDGDGRAGEHADPGMVPPRLRARRPGDAPGD